MLLWLHAFLICLEPVCASPNIFARQNCETFFCPDNSWDTFGTFLKNSFGSTPELPALPDSWESPETPPSKEPDVELQISAPQPEQDRCSALAPKESDSQDLPVSS